jgi:DNA-binding transcriptional MerR regulator
MARRGTRKKTAGAHKHSKVLLGRAALCSIGGITQRQLLLWEHESLIAPVVDDRSGDSSEPLYDPAALERVRLIRTLAEDLEVNLAGIDVILNLLEQLDR